MAAKLEVRGCFDIRPAVEAAAAGACLTARQLQGVASTLEAALALVASVKVTSGGSSGGGEQPQGSAPQGSQPRAGRSRGPPPLYPSLAALAGGVGEEERTLLRALQTCIQNGNVTDAASEPLAAVRLERAANREALRAEVDRWYRLLLSKGAVETGGVRTVRGRACLGVRAGRQGDLPKGSVRLGASTSGATLYVEPQPAVALNNAEALLAEREERETVEVLAMLSRLLGDRRAALLSLVGVFTALDVVAARARHAVWLSGVRPQFVDESSPLLMHVPGALHPVLMQRGLPPLPQPPSIDDNRFDRDFQAAPAWERRRVLAPEGPQAALASAAAAAGGAAGAQDAAAASSLLPRPLDLRVPAGKTVVAITGPNTGGKTVTLKAAGLMALMARAGLFLPCDPRAGGEGGDPRVAPSSDGAASATDDDPGVGPPRVAWFDRVLADIGDAQSLQQSLSTFSGHIRRIKQILAVAGPRSLVLLDEVGSGTDPLEGAALARAVLERLAAQARLTLATTHHAELKRAAEQDPRFVNVSMAFDVASLRPTYRLVWGAAGASNALDIAETLGFDRSVVMEARGIAAAMAAAAASSDSSDGGVGWRESHIAGVARSLVAQIAETRAEVEATRARKEARRQDEEAVKATIDDAQAMEVQLNLAIREIVSERDRYAGEVQTALNAFAAGQQPQADVETALRRIEELIPAEFAAHRGQYYDGGGEDGEDGDGGGGGGGGGGALKPGDSVMVLSHGDWGSAKVSSVKGDYVSVRFDANVMLSFGKQRASRAVKVHKREVRKVRESAAAVPFGVSGLAAVANSLLDLDSRVSGVLQREAEREAQRQAPSQAAASAASGGAPYASYSDLAADLGDEVAGVEEDLARDYGSQELNFLLQSQEEEEEGEEQQQPSVGVEGRKAGSKARGATARGGVGGDGSSGHGDGGGGGGGRRRDGADRGSERISSSEARGGSAGRGGVDGQRGNGGATEAAAVAELGAAAPTARLFPLSEQTDANTIDVAGEVPELAAADVEEYLRGLPPGSALFVRHGTGTGAVREAVHALLRGRRRAARGRVLEFREAPGSRGEVTVVFM